MRLHCIIRAAGERTADACCAALIRQTSANDLERIELTPFWRTLREGLTRGMNSGAPWVLSVDADVLPSPEVVPHVMKWIGAADPKVAVVSGMIQDKFTATVRFGGIRLYRAEALSAMLDAMPEMGETVRPESTAIKRLTEQGWKHSLVPELVGLHDYEQYFRDIYRKAFLHMQKHGARMARFLELWMRLADEDADYQAALAGAADALVYRQAVDCDAGHEAFEDQNALARLGLLEKGPFEPARMNYAREIERLQALLDHGVVAPVSPDEQVEYERSQPEAVMMQQLARIGDVMKRLAAQSPALASASIHQVRRSISDDALLRTFSPGQLAAHLFRRWRRSI
jgi:hypothetical protein